MKMTQTLNFGLELKALSERQFEGHGSVFGNVDLGGDVVIPGAFKRSLSAHRKAGTLPAMFWMHDPSQVAGAWHDMREDDKGLYVRGELADTTLGNEMRTLLGMKAVRGLSIGYRTRDSDYDEDGNRLLKEIDLWEVSLVSLAMNPLAQVEAMKARLSGLGEYVPSEREFERLLRDAGLSRKVARHVCAKVYDAEPGGEMPQPSLRWDAGDVESKDEAAEVLKAINGLTDRIGSAALSR
jgi:HK97 family phage prohead protease